MAFDCCLTSVHIGTLYVHAVVLHQLQSFLLITLLSELQVLQCCNTCSLTMHATLCSA
jgi:hypothetical protein